MIYKFLNVAKLYIFNILQAVAAVEAMSDRVCIHSNGTKNFRYSSEDMLSCCDICGFGCSGGLTGAAWHYWVKSGIVSGGSYGTKQVMLEIHSYSYVLMQINHFQGCRPYEIPPCEHDVNGTRPTCSGKHFQTPKCLKTCEDNYPITYENDRHFGKSYYRISSNPDDIRKEIFENGPVEASFTVFSDFLHYKSGILYFVLLK